MRNAFASLFSRRSRDENAGEESGPLVPPEPNRRISEYESIGVTVVLGGGSDANAGDDPATSSGVVLMHDFKGPLLANELGVTGDDLNGDGSAGAASDDASLILERLSSAVGDVELVMDELPPSDAGGRATIASEVAGMAKNLIGCGCLSLPNGIARCANRATALWDANLWILVLAFIFGYFCYLIAKICHLTGRTTYRGIWEATVGHKGSLAVSVANALKAAMADLAYATILSDTLRSLLLGLVGWQVPRVACLLLVTVLAILPLCLLRDLQVLAPFSLLGTAGVAFTAGAMVWRYLDGSYRPGGKFYDDVTLENQPYFGTVDNSWSFAILPFVCMVYEVPKALFVC
jgi:Transmembrane amino acid transporter protein